MARSPTINAAVPLGFGRAAVCPLRAAARWLAAHARSSYWWPLPRWAELAMPAGAHLRTRPVPKHQPRARAEAAAAARGSREERAQPIPEQILRSSICCLKKT
jgi:hypothetical protein